MTDLSVVLRADERLRVLHAAGPRTTSPVATRAKPSVNTRGAEVDLSVIVVGDHHPDAVLESLVSLLVLQQEYPRMRTEAVVVADELTCSVLRQAVSGDLVTIARTFAAFDQAAGAGLASALGSQKFVMRAGEALSDGMSRALAAKCGAVPESSRASSFGAAPLPERLLDLGIRLEGEFTGSPDHIYIEGPTEVRAGITSSKPVHVGAFSYTWSTLTVAVESVGRYCSIARDVSFGESEHPTDLLSTSPFGYGDGGNAASHLARTGRRYVRRQFSAADYHAPISIGNDVWIGAQAYVKGGVTLGDGCVIGTNAVVTRDVPPYAVLVGNPGRVVRQRFDDATVADLLRIRWWQYDCADFDGIDVSDPASAVAEIERRVMEGAMLPYGGYRCSLGEIFRHLES